MGEALTERGEMEGEMDKEKKEEALDPSMMEDDQIKWIMVIYGRTCNGVPWHEFVQTRVLLKLPTKGTV
jgi:hypothetical protein